VSEGTVLRKIKVSDKGQISIPVEMRKELGIQKGDELLLLNNRGRLIIEKPGRVIKLLEDDLSDLMIISETSMRKLWSPRSEDVWNRYLEE
jgi:AbrB family looped-hinge helix DNA binding protein